MKPAHALFLGLASFGAAPLAAATVNYEKELLPLLKDNCLACHNKTTTKGGLNMETPELMRQGGDSGAGLEPGQGDKSLVYQAAAGDWDSEMPPKSNKVGAVALTSNQLALLKQWIDEGALHSARQEQTIAWQPLPQGFRPIYAASVTADGSYAAAARGNQISVYHLPTQALVTRLTDEALRKSGLYPQPGVAHRDVVPAIAFSPDGSLLATGSFREVKLWQRQAAAPQNVAAPAAPAPSGKFRLAAAGADAVQLVDQPTGQPLRTVKAGGPVTAFILSPDQQRFATATADGALQLWETATGKRLLDLRSDWSSARRQAELADAAAGAAVEASWQAEALKKAEKEVADLAARLKKANDLAVAAKKTLEDKRKEAQAKTAARTAADQALAAVRAQTAQAAGGKPDAALAKKQADAEALAAKTATEATQAQEALERAEAAIQDTAAEIKLVTELSAQAAQAVAGVKTAQAAAQKALTEANAAKAASAKPVPLPAAIALAFAPAGDRLAALDAAGVVRLWASASGKPVGQHPAAAVGKAQALAWPSAAGWVVSGDQGSVLQPDPARAEWRLLRSLGSGDGKSPITDRVASLAFTADGKTLAVGSGEPSRSGDITLWDLASGQLRTRFDERHLDTVLSLDFSPDGKRLASGGADKAVRVTDLASGKVVKVFEGHTHHVLGLSWRADGRLLASAGADNVVKIWDWVAGDRRKNIDGWDKEVTSLRYVGRSDLLATTSGDGKVRLVTSEGAGSKVLATVPGFVNALQPTRAGDGLVAGGQDGVLRVWDVAAGKESAQFTAEAR